MSKYWHDVTFLLFMLHPNKWKITKENFHYLIIKTSSYSHETNFNLMKNRQLGNGFPMIRVIRFFLSMFSIYQGLQNWRSLLINIAGCSCSELMLWQKKKKGKNIARLSSSSAAFGGKREGPHCAFFRRGWWSRLRCPITAPQIAGKAPALLEATWAMSWSCVSNIDNQDFDQKLSLEHWESEFQGIYYNHTAQAISRSGNKVCFDPHFLLKDKTLLFLTQENSVGEFIAWVRVTVKTTRASPETSDMRQCVKWPRIRNSTRNLSSVSNTYQFRPRFDRFSWKLSHKTPWFQPKSNRKINLTNDVGVLCPRGPHTYYL